MPRADLRRAIRDQMRDQARRAENALPLAESEARHRALVDALPEPVLLQDADGSLILANQAARQALGVAADGTAPSPRTAPLPRQTGPRAAADSASRAQGQITVRAIAALTAEAAEAARTGRARTDVAVEVLGDDAAPRPLRATVLPLIGDDGRAGAVVTRLQEAPAAVREAAPGEAADGRGEGTEGGDELFRYAMQYSPIGFAVAALNGRFLRVNRRLCRMLGYRADELQERTLFDLLHPADLEETSLQVGHLLRGDLEAVTLSRRYLGNGGMQLWGMLSVCLVRGESGRPVQLVVQIEDISEVHRAQALLTHMTLHDGVSGLPNRTLLLEAIRDGLDGSGRDGRRVAVLHCDIDQFRVINAHAGAEQGDAVLAEVGRRISRALRPGDVAGRLGGDEFVVVCTGVADEADAIGRAERVQAEAGAALLLGDGSVVPSLSVGIALSTTSDADPAGLLRDAEIAGYQAKDGGRNGWHLVDGGLRRQALERLDLERGLRASLAGGGLELHFQPIVDVGTREIVGREALLRWRHPDRGLLAPGHFLHVAEESGLIGEIGRWVLREAARVATTFGGDRGYVSINVSPSQVTRPGLAVEVEKALAETGLGADRLMVELTESVMLSSAPSARAEIEALDALGVRVVVDDFGTGFGALSYLRDLPVSGIKVDRSFTAGLGTDIPSERIVEALTGLGRGLGVDVIVEGVETERQRELLAAIGAEHAQGYLFGRPEPVPA